MPGAFFFQLPFAQRRVHVADQVVQRVGEGVDAVFGAAVAQGRQHQRVHHDTDAAADQHEHDDLPELGPALCITRGRDIGGEGEERRGGHLGALGAQRPPPSDGQGRQRHQHEREQLRAGQQAQHTLQPHAHGDRTDAAQGLHHRLVDGDLHDQHRGERRERRRLRGHDILRDHPGDGGREGALADEGQGVPLVPVRTRPAEPLPHPGQPALGCRPYAVRSCNGFGHLLSRSRSATAAGPRGTPCRSPQTVEEVIPARGTARFPRQEQGDACHQPEPPATVKELADHLGRHSLTPGGLQGPAQAGVIGDDLSVEDGVAGEPGQPRFGLGASWPGQRRMVGLRTRLGEKVSAGEGFFGLVR